MEWLGVIALRAIVVVVCLTTLLPPVRVGFWPVRLCDFLRLQTAGLALLGALLGGWLYYAQRTVEPLIGLTICAAIAIWQFRFVLPYTRCWRKQIPPAVHGSGGGVRVAVVNLKFDNSQKAEVLQQLRELDLDLLLLIEIDQAWQSALSPLEERYPYRTGVVREEGLGLMLWSRLPLHNPQTRYLVTPNRASIFTDIHWQRPSDSAISATSDVLRFVGVHPLPPGLPDEVNGGRHDSRVRDAELMLVAKHISQSPSGQWVVTGDFNDVAWSHTTRMFQRLSGLVDPRVGRGLYNTYHAQHPWLRFPIDQVFLSPGARLHHIDRVRPCGSDHFAIVTEFSFVGQEPAPLAEQAEDRQEAEEMIDEGREQAVAES